MKSIPRMHDFLSGLSPAGSVAFLKMSVLRKVRAGTPLYLKGDPSAEIFQVVLGKVRLCNVTLSGREMVTTELQTGDCFGEMGVIDGLPRASDAIAVEDTTVRVLRKSQFDVLMTEFPELSRLLLETLCHRARALYALTEESQLSLRQRVARAVLRLACSQGIGDQRGHLTVHLSQEALAGQLGASRQSVNRELKTLVNEGLLAVNYGRITVLELDAMKQEFESQIGMEQIGPLYDKGVISNAS